MAGDVIESLEIKLNSDATKANSAVDKLVGNLNNLESSLAKINGSGSHLVGLGKGVQQLGTGMQSLQGIGGNTIGRKWCIVLPKEVYCIWLTTSTLTD